MRLDIGARQFLHSASMSESKGYAITAKPPPPIVGVVGSLVNDRDRAQVAADSSEADKWENKAKGASAGR